MPPRIGTLESSSRRLCLEKIRILGLEMARDRPYIKNQAC